MIKYAHNIYFYSPSYHPSGCYGVTNAHGSPPPRNRSMKYEAITFWHNQCPHYKGILIQKSNNYCLKCTLN